MQSRLRQQVWEDGFLQPSDLDSSAGSTMRIGVLGMSGGGAPIIEREAMGNLCREWMDTHAARQSCFPFVNVSTCHRYELFFSYSCKEHAEALFSFLREYFPIDQFTNLYTLWGFDCFQHLLEVTAGLHSVIQFETDIQRQVKQAYRESCAMRPLSKELHFLFQKTLKLAKEIRSRLIPVNPLATLEGAIFHLGTRYFEEKSSPRILFVGASKTNRSIASYLQHRGWNRITFCNRSPWESGEFGTLAWSDRECWTAFDWVIVATKASGYLLPLPASPCSSPVLILDLSVPRNVHPEFTYLPGVTLYNIDQLDRIWQKSRPKIDEVIAEISQWSRQAVRKQIGYFSKKNTSLIGVA